MPDFFIISCIFDFTPFTNDDIFGINDDIFGINDDIFGIISPVSKNLKAVCLINSFVSSSFFVCLNYYSYLK